MGRCCDVATPSPRACAWWVPAGLVSPGRWDSSSQMGDRASTPRPVVRCGKSFFKCGASSPIRGGASFFCAGVTHVCYFRAGDVQSQLSYNEGGEVRLLQTSGRWGQLSRVLKHVNTWFNIWFTWAPVVSGQ